MALQIGTENKKQVYLLIALLIVIAGIGGYELYNNLSSPSAASAPVPAARPQAAAARGAQGRPAGAGADARQDAQRLSNDNIDPTLDFDKLAASEDVDYGGSGRNIFSANSAPPIPKPIVPPRPNPSAVNTPPPPVIPTAPPIDLKYFGYSQTPDKLLKAFFVHGDDIFIAATGQIVDHRYKVGAITPGSVEVTDMAYNNTKTLNLSAAP